MEKDYDKNELQNTSPKSENQENAPRSSAGATFFEIHVKGHLNSTWSDWLEELEMKLLDNGEMVLFGPIADQAALLGVLNKLGRLNLALVSVNEAEREGGAENDCNTRTEP